MSLQKSVDRLEMADAFLEHVPPPLSFGNKYLDDATNGIFADDLVVLTARTGAGKTECVTQIAQYNATRGKHVAFFALEAHKEEIELRMKFKLLSQAFFIANKDWKEYDDIPNYQRWIAGKQNELFAKYQEEVNQEFRRLYPTLHTFYREENFNANHFESEMARIGDKTDLVIVDHLHYFDLDSDNEAQELKRTLKQIKTVASYHRKPTILVVHVRKQNRGTRGLLPDTEEIHGSSEISKIATRVIAVGPAYDQVSDKPYIFPTYFKLLKNRWDGSRCRFVGLCGFDVQINAYAEKYKVGKFQHDDTEFVECGEYDLPSWTRIKAGV